VLSARVLNAICEDPVIGPVDCEWDWEATGPSVQWQSQFRTPDQFGADLGDDFVSDGAIFGASGQLPEGSPGQFVVVGVRPFDGAPIGDYVWSPPVAIQEP
jgi:hypothetical protein